LEDDIMPLSNPRVQFAIKSAYERTINEEQKILVMAQMVVGSAAFGVLQKNVGSASEEDSMFGADSMAATAVRAIRRISKAVRIDVLPLRDGLAAVGASGAVPFLGTAQEDGVLRMSLASEIHNTYEVAVFKGETAAQVATAFDTRINADTTCVLNSSVSTATLELDAINAGQTGNFIGIWVTGTIAGLSYTVTAMNGGVGEPDDITDKSAFDALDPDIRYQGIVYPQTYGIANQYEGLREWLDPRFNADNRILDGMAFVGVTDTLSNLDTLAATINDKQITLFGDEPVSEDFQKVEGVFELDYIRAAYFTAIRALRLTAGAQVENYIVGTSGSLDNTGGMALASLPYMNTPFTNLLPVSNTLFQWDDAEVTELEGKGVSVIGNNVANNNVVAGQVVTTYLTDAVGNDDITFKFLNYVDTFSNIREYYFNSIKVRFAQSRLTTGDITPLRNEANAGVIASFMLGKYSELETAVLVKKGQEARKFFKKNLSITINEAAGSVAISMIVIPIVQLREMDIVMQIAFNVTL